MSMPMSDGTISSTPGADVHPNRVLVVDDERHVLSALRRVLVRNGYEVVVEDDPGDALNRLERFHPDVVISDFRMPGWTMPAHLREPAADTRGTLEPLTLTSEVFGDVTFLDP